MLSSPRPTCRPSVCRAFKAVAAVLLTLALTAPGCQPAVESGPAVSANTPQSAASETSLVSTTGPESSAAATPAASLPLLLDLGATKCIPCKMMAPILEELKEEYAGRMDVVFIDVWEDNAAGDKYGIQSIPTQIFFDAAGKELFRHEGFIAKQDILAKWQELGFEFAGATAPRDGELELQGPEQVPLNE